MTTSPHTHWDCCAPKCATRAIAFNVDNKLTKLIEGGVGGTRRGGSLVARIAAAQLLARRPLCRRPAAAVKSVTCPTVTGPHVGLTYRPPPRRRNQDPRRDPRGLATRRTASA
jgi:hypothetical protein